ncbi:MAG TPA: substrate-binding domain-containing protein [Polyangiaceae bacterium]|nr:substrate-binding domain-containing protein [Polyangiaceae bacterium]
MERAHDAKTLSAGTIVGGGYRVLRVLAEGGMGTVYEVEQIATGARRALKVMHGQFARDPDLRTRFVREARLGTEIPSDHVAQIIDAGDDEPTRALYIVMELLDGATLSQELRRRGAFAWADVLEIVRQVVHALGAAHANGIVHRDLKPANVFLSRSRHAGLPLMVKVLDFGIAKAMQSGGETTLSVLGTPAWMAPEQSAPDADVGPQADIWALGLLAFILLAGKHYFPSAAQKNVATAAVLREVVIEPMVPASQRASELGVADRLPAGFDEWFAHCVHRNPNRRFADANEAYAALAALPAPSPREPVPVPIAQDPPPSTTSLQRIDTPITAIETPHPSRARALSAPPTRSSTGSTARSRFTRLGVGAVAAASVVGGWFYLHQKSPDPPASEGTAATRVAPPVSTALVRLHGSNTIGAELAPKLAEAFLRKRTGSPTVVTRHLAPDELVVEARTSDGRVIDSIEVFAHGSATAFEDLAAGRCDIGMSSRRIHEDEASKLAALGNMASAASEHVVALDGIAVIENPSNPVTTLTTAQIADVFSGKLRKWTDVGGADRSISVLARDDKSGTFDTFKHMVLGSLALGADAKRFESSEALSDAVAEDAGAIGFIGLPYVRSAKAVLVQDGKSVPLIASPMTVASEDYPLARRLYLYVPLSAQPVSRELVDFATSDEGQRVVQDAGFVDLQPRCDPNASRCTSCGNDYRDAVRGACRLSVTFRFDGAGEQLDTRALTDLQRVVALMGRSDDAAKSVRVLGFSGADGSRAGDVAASLQDANIVATQLRARGLHVDVVEGFGHDAPVADDSTEAGRQRNRRVEVWLR